jgi:hypothetical protein
MSAYEDHRRWVKKNKEKFNEYQKQYAKRNREKIAERKKKYREKNLGLGSFRDDPELLESAIHYLEGLK